MPKIQPISLRSQIRDRIAEQLWQGVYGFGEDLNEARLAAELGVSRTPLREALVMLASEGLIEALPNRGFHVPALRTDVVAELYPILGALESLAVQNSEGDLVALADKLDTQNRKVRNPQRNKLRANSADAEWHEILVSQCGNGTLQGEIAVLRSRSRSIDGALFRGLANAEGSADDHAAIAGHIREGKLSAAATAVADHWAAGIKIVSRWIEEVSTDAAVR